MSGCSSIIASRVAKSQWTLSEPGSADLWMGMPVKMWPLTLRTGVPHAMPSSVSGSFNPISRTSSKPRPLRERIDVATLTFQARAVVLREPRDAAEDRVGVQVRFRDHVRLQAAAQPVVVEVGGHRVFVGERTDVAQRPHPPRRTRHEHQIVAGGLR